MASVTDVTVSCSLGKTASDTLTDTTSAALAGGHSATAGLGSHRALISITLHYPGKCYGVHVG